MIIIFHAIMINNHLWQPVWLFEKKLLCVLLCLCVRFSQAIYVFAAISLYIKIIQFTQSNTFYEQFFIQTFSAIFGINIFCKVLTGFNIEYLRQFAKPARLRQQAGLQDLVKFNPMIINELRFTKFEKFSKSVQFFTFRRNLKTVIHSILICKSYSYVLSPQHQLLTTL